VARTPPRPTTAAEDAMASKEGEGGSGSEPNPSEHILCVDVGTTALKLLLSHRSGAEVSCSTEDYDTDSYATTDPEIWWDAFLRGAEKCVKCLGPGDVVAAVALTGQMQNLLLFDGKDKPTCPLIPYNDSRAGKQAELIESMGMRLEGKAMSEVVGNWKRGYSILPKILWVKEHWREAWAKTKRVLLGSHSFIAMKLCGKYSCDPTTGRFKAHLGSLIETAKLHHTHTLLRASKQRCHRIALTAISNIANTFWPFAIRTPQTSPRLNRDRLYRQPPQRACKIDPLRARGTVSTTRCSRM